MHLERETYHVHGLLDVGFPITALLRGIYAADNNLVLLFSVGSHVEVGEPRLAAILGTCKKVKNLLFLLGHTLSLLLWVCYVFAPKDTVKVLIRNLNVVLQRRCILDFALLGHCYESLNVVPLRAQDRSPIRNRIISVVNSRNACENGKLRAFLSREQIGVRILFIEQRNYFHIVNHRRVAPVGIKHMLHLAFFIHHLEAAIHCLFTQHPYYLCPVGIEDKNGDGEAPMLEVLSHTHEEKWQVVEQLPILHIFRDFCSCLGSVVLKPVAIAHLRIPHQARGKRLVLLNEVENVVWH